MAWARVTRASVAALATAVLLTGCSWRMETEPDPFRTPSAITVLRDHVAAAEQAVATAATSAEGAKADAEAAAVPTRLAALGGVSPTSSPRPAADLAAAVAAAQAAAADCMDGAGEDPLGTLCASILLSHATIAGVAEPATAPDSVLEGGTAPGADSAVGLDTVARLALEHDRLRALYEVIAARAKGDERTEALAASGLQRERAAALLAIDGVANLTQPAYDIPAGSVASKEARAATALAAERTLADNYAALLVAAAPADRPWLLNAAYTGYVTAAGLGLSAGEVPALPGTTSGS